MDQTDGNYLSYYAVIPARVLHSMELSSSAKLLYGEISVRCNERGYCWASNQCFASYLRIGERTVSRLIAELEAAGEIRSEYASKSEGKVTRERRLFLRDALASGIDKNGDTANFVYPCVAKNGDANIGLILRDNNNTPLPPKGGRGAIAFPRWKPERFESFWTWYRQNCRPDNRSGAVKAWDKLKPDDDTIRAMGQALRKLVDSDLWRRGVGIPYASTFLNGRKWEDVSELCAAPEGGWAEDREVI